MRTLAYRLSRRLELYPFAAAPEQIGVLEGLRAATAVAVMVAAAFWLQWPRLSWAAFGAFWVCLADPGGPARRRFAAMAGFAAAGTVVAFIASCTAGISPVLAGAALLPLVFLPSLSGTYGAVAGQSGMLVCVVAVVAVEFPGSAPAAFELAGIFLLGCVWALILCIGIWRIHPHAPARRAIASVFARLGDMTSELLASDQRGTAAGIEWTAFNAEHRRSVRAAIERARAIVTELEGGGEIYRLEIDFADAIFAGLIAAGHDAGERDLWLDRQTEGRLLGELLPLLAEAGHQAARRTPDSARLSTEASALHKQALDIDSVTGRAVVAAAKAMEDLAALWGNGVVHCAESSGAAREGPIRIRPIPANMLRHAARTSIGVAVAYAIAVRLDLTFSYWATMATVVVLQPFAPTAWPRTLERMAGSVAGGLLATALMALVPTKLALLAMIFPVAAATIAFRFVNYTVFVFFLTPLFVLVTELLQPGAGIASARAINNIIGSLVALAASYLIRSDQGGSRIGDKLADAVAANLTYAAQVIATSGTSPALDLLRRQAGVASGAAESLRHRMILEGRKRRARLTEIGELLEALRVLAGAATARALAVCEPDEARSAALGPVIEALSTALRDPSAAAPIPAIAHEPHDDIDRSIRAVTIATKVYLGALSNPAPACRTARKWRSCRWTIWPRC